MLYLRCFYLLLSPETFTSLLREIIERSDNMRIIIVISVTLLAVSNAFAADFTPTVLELRALESLQYDFDGEILEIPVIVSGTGATVVFCIFTKDKASAIRKVNNGHLGWHHVNKTDTCIYFSPPTYMNSGKSNLEWEGKDQDNDGVPSGEYTYYLFGYDNKSSKVPVSEDMPFLWDDSGSIETHDIEGNPLPHPVIYSGVNEWKTQLDPWERIRSKWVVGTDPGDETLIETTLYSGWNEHCRVIPDPGDDSRFFITTTDNSLIGHLRNYTWVPNSEAELMIDWGYNGEFLWEVNSQPGEWCAHQPLLYAGDGMLITTNTDLRGFSDVSELLLVDIDEGEEAYRIDLSDWWIKQGDADAGGQKSSGPTDMDIRHGMVILGSNSSCMNQMIDPFAEEDDEWNVWVNGNGDYIGDKNFEEDSGKPWICHDADDVLSKYSISLDSNLFSLFPADGLGTSSFGLYAPDGTGIGYFAFVNENAGFKYGQHFVDADTPYDGIYCDNASLGTPGKGWWYIAQDSFKGTVRTHGGINFGLVSPNGGEVWNAGSVQEITWDYWLIIKSAGQAGGDLQIEFSSDGGKSWSMIAVNIDRNSESYIWTVPEVESSQCLIRLADMNNPDFYADVSDGFFSIVPGTAVEETKPLQFSVSQNTPNPFNPATTVGFTVPKAGVVTVEVFNTTGQKVETLVSEFKETGSHSVFWDAGEHPAGVYFCTVRSGKLSETIKMTLLK